MKRYKCTAESVGYLETTILAENEDEAWEKFNSMLENGEVPEVDGSIENEDVEEVKDETKTS